MQLLSETGLFGFVFVFGFFIFVLCLIKQLFLKIVKRKNYSNFQITSIISIFILLWPISPHQNFFNNWVCVLYFISFGIFLLSIKKKINKLKILITGTSSGLGSFLYENMKSSKYDNTTTIDTKIKYGI